MTTAPARTPDVVGAPAPRRVVVVMAAFNARKTIDAALASVAAQTLPPTEVVVVDDGSSDGTATVARQWSGTLPLRVLSLESNRGPAVARDRAIRSLGGDDLVALLDADDVWLPAHLRTMTDLYLDVGGLVCARGLRWVPGYGVAPQPTGRPPGSAGQLRAALAANFVFSGTVFSVHDYLRAGGFREQTNGAEDWDLWLRMIRAGAVVTSPEHPSVVYRVSPGSLSAGDRCIRGEIAMLRLAEAEARTPEERDWARRSLRRSVARGELAAAYALARATLSSPARRRALGALGGSVNVALRAMAVVVSPQRAVRVRDRLQAEPARRLAA